MKIETCSKCGHELDSANHYLQCINKKGTWKSYKKVTEWD